MAWSANPALVVQAAGVRCAFALSHVVETMRPLSIKPLSNVPDFIRGVSLVRGRATPVLDLASFFQGRTPRDGGRFVTLRTGERTVAVLVDDVLGIRKLGPDDSVELPPLFRGVNPSVMEAIQRLDSDLVVVLATARLVPEAVWRAIREAEVER